MKNILIVGAGQVGAHIAQQAIAKNLNCNISLLDLNQSLTQAQTLDLKDTLMFSQNTKVNHISKEEIKADEMDLIIITSGANQEPGETRTDLLEKNTTMLKSLAKQLTPLHPDTIILMVTNPVDLLTQVARQYFDLPHSQIMGTGTLLDSSRLRWRISEKLQRNISNIHGYVLGEHGDSQFIAWSTVTGSNTFSEKEKTQIAHEVSSEAYDIIEGKGATYFGIGAATIAIVDAIINDHKAMLPVSTNYPHFDDSELTIMPIGIPSIIGAKGIIDTPPLNLTTSEFRKLESSVQKLIAL